MKTYSASCIYVIEAAVNGQTKVKIGYAQNIASRLHAIRCGSPVPVRLAYGCVLNTKTVRAVELAVHALCDPYWSHGEWFNITADQAIDFIRQTLVRFGHDEVRVPQFTKT